MLNEQISVLIIEDNPGDIILIKEMLNDNDLYLIDSCNDLESAINKIQDSKFDIALVDLGLPGCTDTDAPKMIINEMPNLPIVVLTGSDDPNLIENLLNMGIQDFLIKGNFDKDILIRSIRYSIQRAKVYQELKMEKYFASNIINTAHAIVLVLDTKGNILTMNKFLEDLTNYTYNEVRNKNWIELFIPKDIKTDVENAFHSILDDNLDQGYINHIIKKNGDKVFIEWFYSILKDENNEIIGILSIGHDISKVKEAEISLGESEEKFRNLAENSPVSILMYQDDYWVYANSFALKTTGFSIEELKKMKFWEFVHPDDQSRIKMLGKKRQIHEEADVSYEFKVITRDNEVRWVWLSGTNCMFNGKPAGLISVMDITNRKEAEQELLRLSSAVQQSHSIVVLTDISGNIIYANPMFTKITGYTLEEAQNKNPRLLKSGDMPPEFYSELWEVVTSGEIWVGEMSNQKKDGTIYWEKAIISPVFDENKKIMNYLKIAEDITDKKRMESELEEHREHLEEMVEERTDQLNEKLKELESLNKLFLNREHRIKELRDELKKYKK